MVHPKSDNAVLVSRRIAAKIELCYQWHRYFVRVHFLVLRSTNYPRTRLELQTRVFAEKARKIVVATFKESQCQKVWSIKDQRGRSTEKKLLSPKTFRLVRNLGNKKLVGENGHGHFEIQWGETVSAKSKHRTPLINDHTGETKTGSFD